MYGFQTIVTDIGELEWPWTA